MERKIFKAEKHSAMPVGVVSNAWFSLLLKVPFLLKMTIFIGLSEMELTVKRAFRECVFDSVFTHHMALCASKARRGLSKVAVIILLMKPNDGKMILCF